MKAIAYSVKTFEKEFLAKANRKKHDITLISNALTIQTADYAKGKDAVLVFATDDVSATIINKLATFGIKYIATRSSGMDHIDQATAASNGIILADVPAVSLPPNEDFLIDSNQAFLITQALEQIAEQTIKNLDCWQVESNKKIPGPAI